MKRIARSLVKDMVLSGEYVVMPPYLKESWVPVACPQYSSDEKNGGKYFLDSHLFTCDNGMAYRNPDNKDEIILYIKGKHELDDRKYRLRKMTEEEKQRHLFKH